MKSLLLLVALLLPWPASALPPPGAEAPISAEINPLELIDRLEALAERHSVPEISALAARLGTAETALAFVREHVRPQAYPGMMRGARGALLARGGNATDRALLLAALLEAQGVRHRFASAELTAAQAAPLLAAVLATRSAPPALEGPFGRAVAARAEADAALLNPAGLALVAAGFDASLARSEALSWLGRHVWVEMERDGAWVALDPATAAPGETLAAAEAHHAEPPAEWAQRVAIRVVAEHLREGRLESREVLATEMPAAEASRSRLVLTFQDPQRDAMGGAALGRAMGLAQRVPILFVKDGGVRGEAFPLGAAGATAGGGLGGLMAALDAAPAAAPLTGVFLELHLTAPGAEPLTVRRVLFDALPAAQRLALEAGQAPIQAPPAMAAPPAVLSGLHVLHLFDGAHNLGGWLGASAGRLHALLVAAAEEAPDAAMPAPEAMLTHSVMWRLLPILSDRLALAAVDDHPALRATPTRPRAVVVSMVPDGERVGISFDWMQDAIAFLPAEDVPPTEVAARALRFAALQHAIEVEAMGMALADAARYGPVEVIAASGRGPLRAATAADAPAAGIALRRRIAAGAPALLAEGARGTFWEIDPARGHVRAVLEPGLGGADGLSQEAAWRQVRMEQKRRAAEAFQRVYTVDNRGNVLRETLAHGTRQGRRVDQMGRAAQRGPRGSQGGAAMEYVWTTSNW